jgi:hypothetical protein
MLNEDLKEYKKYKDDRKENKWDKNTGAGLYNIEKDAEQKVETKPIKESSREVSSVKLTSNKIKIFNRTNEDLVLVVGNKKITFNKLSFTEVDFNDYLELEKENYFAHFRGKLIIQG